jgi:hypothetical protein
LEAQHVAQVRPPHAADADVGDDKSIVGARPAGRCQDASWNKRGKTHGGGAYGGAGDFEEMAAIEAVSVVCHVRGHKIRFSWLYLADERRIKSPAARSKQGNASQAIGEVDG